MIKKIFVDDALKSAILHQKGMPDDFLPGFGLDFLEILHIYLLKSLEVIALGYYQQKKLAGIIIASTDTSKMMQNIFKTGFARMFKSIVKKSIVKPQTLLYLLQTIIYGRKMVPEIKAELIILAVDTQSRRKKIGSQLIQELKKELGKKNIKIFKVGALASNKPANAFYEKNGGKFLKQFSIYSRMWNIYLFKL